MCLFTTQVCFVIGYIKAFIPKLMFSQRFHGNVRQYVFSLRAFVLGRLIPSMKLDGRENIQSANSPRSFLPAEPGSCQLYRGIIKDVKQKKNTHTRYPFQSH